MTALFAAELRRMWSRRLLRVLLLVSTLVLVVVAGTAFYQSGRDPREIDEEMAAQRQFAMESCLRGEFGGPTTGLEGEELQAACNDMVGEDPAGVDPRFHYAEVPDVWLGLSPLLAIMALVLGASFVGADWQKGTMTTALTWEPRRIRLLGAKFLTVAVTGALFTILLELLIGVAFLPAALAHGTFEGMDATWRGDAAEMGLRIAAIGSLVAIVGCALATVGRHTAAALGVAFVYFAFVENLIRGLRPKWQPWLLGDNVAYFLSEQTPDPVIAGRTQLEVALILVGYCAIFIVLAMGFFKRRDIT